MNTTDSKEANEELVCIWNAIEERAEDQEIVDYARSKRIQLDRLLQEKNESDKQKKEYDKQYAMLIEKEIREVQKYDKARKKVWR
jgi:hypothetical protein